ncbi:GNAT family N-acetyltransferase [Paenibacillus sp. yr247]
MATKPEFRGRGFGSAMFNFLITEAQKQNTRPCILLASPSVQIYTVV